MLPFGVQLGFHIAETSVPSSYRRDRIVMLDPPLAPGLRAAASARNRLEPRLRNLEPARAGLYYRPPSRGLPNNSSTAVFFIYLRCMGTCKLSRARTRRQIKLLEAGSPHLRRETSRTGSNRLEQLYSAHYRYYYPAKYIRARLITVYTSCAYIS
jgi:hypothetical protein